MLLSIEKEEKTEKKTWLCVCGGVGVGVCVCVCVNLHFNNVLK